MSATFVSELAQWPIPELGVFPLRVADETGEPANWYGPTMTEVTIFGPKNEDGETLVVSIAFASMDHALRAGKILGAAFAEVQELQNAPTPDPETCEHRPRVTRFSRELKKQRLCELCAAHLGTLHLDRTTGEWVDDE